MKKILFGIIFLLNMSYVYADNLLDSYFSNDSNPVLTKQEIEALELIKDWKAGTTQQPVLKGADGKVTFLYGMSQPSILTAVFQITDIELEPGEVIYSLHIGDSSRWMIEPATTGSAKGNIMHIIVKPRDVGLSTSMIITTDRRTYHLQLKSHKTKYMPRVSFTYPQTLIVKYSQLQAQKKAERNANTLSSGEYLGSLDFNYKISGKAKWKPVRVYNDGIKTVIEMPKAMVNDEAPVLLIMKDDSSTPALINYRLIGARYIADGIFDEAILISGKGMKQKKIVIKRSKK